jgi:endonuclease/exonuclease/phosphatase family metal-dependent hydrolase
MLLALASTGCASIARGGAAKEHHLKVMSYNIQYGNEGLDSVIAVINAEKPDIVGLQELDVHWDPRSRFVDQAALIAKGTGMEYRFARIYQLPNADSTKPLREFGVGVLSRYPIRSFTNHTIARLSTQEANPVPKPLPGFLDATLDVNGTPVRVLNVHLDFRRDPAVRKMQVADMLAAMGSSSVPTLMFGDMNARPDAPELEPLFKRLNDSWSYTQGPGLTGPARNPAGKIDYVLMSDHFRTVRTWVPRVYASDHFPVVAELVLSPSLQ